MTEVFKYAGTDLRSAGLYMSVVDGTQSAPPTRGANLLIPYQQGTRWVQKFYGERHVVLAGELTSLASRLDFQQKADLLKSLFSLGLGEQKLEVQWADGTFRYVMAEVINTMGLQWLVFPTRSSPYSIELVASDPIWYGSAGENWGGRLAWFLDSGVSLDDGAHWLDSSAAFFAMQLTAQVTNVEASNGGSGTNRRPVFTLAGPFNGLVITNLRNGYSLKINGVGSRATIDCGAQTVNTDAANPTPTLGAGQTDWMHLESGENTLKVDLGSYSSPVNYQATYAPAYL